MTGRNSVNIFVITTAAHSNAATASAIDNISDFVGGASNDLKVGAETAEINLETVSATLTEADTIAELNELVGE